MTELFREADPRQSTGQPVAVSTMLERGAERVRTELGGQPELQASLMATIGQSFHNMWELAKARKHLSSSLPAAAEVLGESHPDVIRMRYVLGMTTSFSATMRRRCRCIDADHDLLVAAHGARSAEAATELHQIAFIQSMMGEHEAAEAGFTKVIDTFRSLGSEGRAGLATGLMEYGALLKRTGRVEEQAPLQLEALEIRRELYGEMHPDYVAALNNVANFYVCAGRAGRIGALHAEEYSLESRDIRGGCDPVRCRDDQLRRITEPAWQPP
ncbi:MAG: tetratricopeptide repeat protein [Woeseiaceae bacterium]|nr:tetratricopeptide repeat protein [Woeseiaceae bacterium]